MRVILLMLGLTGAPSIRELVVEQVFSNRSAVSARLAPSVDRATASLYGRRSMRPVWIEGSAPSPVASYAAELLRTSSAEGLDPRDYGSEEIDRLLDQSAESERALAELELALTRGVFAYAFDRRGRLDPQTLRLRRITIDEADELAATLDELGGAKLIASLAERTVVEQRLREARANARAIESTLALLGDSWLAFSFRARVERVDVNLERMRGVAASAREVRINIASQSLAVLEAGRSVLSMKVIVGKTQKRTPVFESEITEITTNPSWDVPSSIARWELLPRIIRDPSYLSAQGFRVLEKAGKEWREVDPRAIDWSSLDAHSFPYRLQQRPGPNNALGRLKLTAPNPHRVYLHDTPSRTLFDRTGRTFSHGCIRLDRPLALAEYLLGAERSGELYEKLALENTRTIRVDLPVPLRIVYWTADLDDAGQVAFFPDIYRYDAKLAAALEQLRVRSRNERRTLLGGDV